MFLLSPLKLASVLKKNNRNHSLVNYPYGSTLLRKKKEKKINERIIGRKVNNWILQDYKPKLTLTIG
jgi:hypothetical protein